MSLRTLLFLLAVALLLPASHCFPDDDDDDASDDDDVVADDDDASDDDDMLPPEPYVISGEVIALDRETGVQLTLSQYDARAGGIIVYALPDANNLAVIYGKDTLTGPGDYSIEIDVVGPVDVVAVADEDKNFFIDADDVARQYAFNPVAGGVGDVEDVNLFIDLLPPKGGGDDDDAGDDDDDDDDDGGSCWVSFAGDANLLEPWDTSTNDVAISSNTADLRVGPLDWVGRAGAGAGAWGLDQHCGTHTRAFLGYLDGDGNGFFELCDPIGQADNNPYAMIDTTGIQIDIPSEETIAPPSPTPYVPLTGTVTYGAFTTGDIIVKASHVTVDGYVFSQATLAAPGAFSLIAPADTDDVLVWAVLDADGDGLYNVSVDPFAADGPMNTGTGVSGILLDLGDVESGTFAGVVNFDGAVAPGDELHVGVFDNPEYDASEGPPAGFLVVPNPTFPYEFDFADIAPGTYWIGSYLDIGGDDPDGAGEEDPGKQVGPFLLAPGDSITGIEVDLPPAP